jgi:hypothetical protein
LPPNFLAAWLESLGKKTNWNVGNTDQISTVAANCESYGSTDYHPERRALIGFRWATTRLVRRTASGRLFESSPRLFALAQEGHEYRRSSANQHTGCGAILCYGHRTRVSVAGCLLLRFIRAARADQAEQNECSERSNFQSHSLSYGISSPTHPLTLRHHVLYQPAGRCYIGAEVKRDVSERQRQMVR